jgi:hypothetical protein
VSRTEATASAPPSAAAAAAAASVNESTQLTTSEKGVAGITADALAASSVAMGQATMWSGGGVSRQSRAAQYIIIVLLLCLAAVLWAGRGAECSGGVLSVLSSVAEEGLSGAAGIRYRSACVSQYLS